MVRGGGHSNVTLVCDDEKQLQTPIHAAHIYYGENCVTGTHSGRKQDKTNKVQTKLENKQLKIVTSYCHMLRANYLHYENYLTPEFITNLRRILEKSNLFVQS